MKSKQKVLVFGGSGFLGSHVADVLTKEGYSVTIFDIKKSPYLKENQEMCIGDITNQNEVAEAIKGNEIVYNFAGLADIDECHKRPLEAIELNITANAFMLEAAVTFGVKKYLFASSAYVYSEYGSFYKISKQSSELLVESFSDKSQMDYVILRYGSLYGNRADKRNSLYRILYDSVVHNKIEYFGNGNERREFIHVKDAAILSVEALKKEFKNQILMLSGPSSTNYDDLFEILNEIFSFRLEIKKYPKKSKTHYKMSPYSFSPKMARKLVLNPHTDLGQGLLSLIEEIHNENAKG